MLFFFFVFFLFVFCFVFVAVGVVITKQGPRPHWTDMYVEMTRYC